MAAESQVRQAHEQVHEVDAALAQPAFQYDTLEQEHHSVILGMWIFLTTEIMIFGGLFATYLAYRVLYPQAFAEGVGHMELTIGAVNTGVLIVSSFMVAVADNFAQTGASHKWIILPLLGAIALGLVFLGLKGVEYYHHWLDHLVPALNWDFTGPNPLQVELFFVLYFVMTLLHALHLIMGMGIVAWVIILVRRGKVTPQHYTPVEVAGLYWHFVDTVWIFLLPLLYLIRY